MPGKIGFHASPGIPSAGRLYERARPRQEDKNFYSQARWLRLRDAYLAEHPMCAGPGCTSLASHVHHKRPRKTHPELAYEWSNLEGLCIPCHNAEKVR